MERERRHLRVWSPLDLLTCRSVQIQTLYHQIEVGKITSCLQQVRVFIAQTLSTEPFLKTSQLITLSWIFLHHCDFFVTLFLTMVLHFHKSFDSWVSDRIKLLSLNRC